MYYTQKKPGVTWWYDVEKVFEFIHPDFSQSSVVLIDHLASTPWETVRRRLPKHMAYVGTRDDLQRAATLPDLHSTLTID